MTQWIPAIELNSAREVISGSPKALCDAIRNGADLRINTDFKHNEHIDTTSDLTDVIVEVSEFRVTYLLDDRWTAGFMTQRQPFQPPVEFGPRPSMSFFLYNQDGHQAVGRPFLDGQPATGIPGASPIASHLDMPKYHQLDSWDAQTNAPSENFIYDFDIFRYFVCNRWREVLSHDAQGNVLSGSFADLSQAFSAGCEVKVGIRNLCADLSDGLNHEVFVQICSGFLYPERGYFSAETQPVVRVAPAIPLQYASRNWDFGWFILRTDGFLSSRLCDPYTLAFRHAQGQYAMRWFVND